MTSQLQSAGILKKLTGNQRRRLLELQAAKIGKDPDALLENRKLKKLAWQEQRTCLQFYRCCNCGHVGHNFDFCPFAFPFFLRQSRFRGMNGLWNPEESAVVMSENERLKYMKHFEILSMVVPESMIKGHTLSDISASKTRNNGNNNNSK
jgi:hypothetical protein